MVLSRRDAPFPLDAVRDLIGIARAMWMATPPHERLRCDRLRRIGERLTTAIDLSASTEHGSVGHRAAWENAERACLELGDLVELTDRALPIVEAAARRVLRG